MLSRILSVKPLFGVIVFFDTITRVIVDMPVIVIDKKVGAHTPAFVFLPE
jgi:hypothetical protein